MGSDIKEREQRAARRAAILAVIEWAQDQLVKANTHDTNVTSIESILICDLSSREKGAIYMLVEEFDDIAKAKPEGKPPPERATETATQNCIQVYLMPLSLKLIDLPNNRINNKIREKAQ